MAIDDPKAISMMQSTATLTWFDDAIRRAQFFMNLEQISVGHSENRLIPSVCQTRAVRSRMGEEGSDVRIEGSDVRKEGPDEKEEGRKLKCIFSIQLGVGE